MAPHNNNTAEDDLDDEEPQPGDLDGNQALGHRPPEPHAYEALTPDVVQDALASVDQYGDGRLMALSSYENRVYLAHLENGEAVVAKFYRPGRWSDAAIAEEHSFAAELMAAEIPVVGPLVLQGRTLHHHSGFSFSVSPRRGGRRPELDDFDVLEWIGRFLARIHTVGAARPFAQRPVLGLQTFALEPRDWLLAHGSVAPEVRAAWKAALEEALGLLREHITWDARTGQATSAPVADEDPDADAAAADNTAQDDEAWPRLLRLHGDCHPGNILWTPDQGPHFVDLDDARTGPAVQDLWMLLDGDRAQRTQQLSALLEGYEQFRPFDRRELALIEPLRTLRLIHYSAWLARRWDDPTFPVNFPWFGSTDYWSGQVLVLEGQIEAMREEPLYA